MGEPVALDAQNDSVQETQLLDAAQSLRNARSSLRVIVEELLRDLRNAQEALQAYELPERYRTPDAVDTGLAEVARDST